jgi:hypothetical protein
VLLAACAAPGDEEGAEAAASPQTQAEIEAQLRAYLPVLSHAYASGDIEPLRAYAVERVMAQVEKRVSDLAAGGMVLDPDLRELTVEKVVTWGNDFAMVTTLETWDLHYVSAGAGAPISERLGTRNRVQYQLKKLDGRWTVFHRELQQEFDAEP